MNDDWPDDVPPAERMAQIEAAKKVPGIVWLGDLSGWEVGIMRRPKSDWGDALCLYHRCGWAEPLRPCGNVEDYSVFLANIIERAVEVAQGHTCAPQEPSEEHRARVARWAAAAGPQPARAGHLADVDEETVREVLGDTAADQLAAVRAIAAGAAVVLSATRDFVYRPSLTPLPPRIVDGPGCTPLQVSPPIAGRSLEELRGLVVVDEEPEGPYCACSDPGCPTPDGQYTHGPDGSDA
jgi:hypothetical protein